MATKKILVMGLPTSGKTTFAEELKKQLEFLNYSVTSYNADIIRKLTNNWDFSEKGRMKQARKMRQLAREATTNFVICDFIAPLAEQRKFFNADIIIWMDTIDAGPYEDTNQAFDRNINFDYRITEKNSGYWGEVIAIKIHNSIKN